MEALEERSDAFSELIKHFVLGFLFLLQRLHFFLVEIIRPRALVALRASFKGFSQQHLERFQHRGQMIADELSGFTGGFRETRASRLHRSK